MTTYLRHRASGDLYVYSSTMAKRGDMDMVEIHDEVPAAPVEQPVAPTAPVMVSVEPIAEPVPLTDTSASTEVGADTTPEDDDPSVDLAVDKLLGDIFGDETGEGS
jgi:hypothetical protein